MKCNTLELTVVKGKKGKDRLAEMAAGNSSQQRGIADNEEIIPSSMFVRGDQPLRTACDVLKQGSFTTTVRQGRGLNPGPHASLRRVD